MVDGFDFLSQNIRSQSGYWEFQRRKYYRKRLIRIMIRQYLMVYNYRLGASNDEIIGELNKDFLDTSESKEMSDKSKKKDFNMGQVIFHLKLTSLTNLKLYLNL